MNMPSTNDFQDWLSPIVVKELRQGMRSRVFVGAFLLLQALMIFCVVLGVGFYDDMDADYDWMFWVMIGVPLLCLIPLRGFGTLGGEIKENTLELLYLTRLSAWRITIGKWSALVLQTLLLVFSVLPYTVLRYFLGGVNLLTDLQVLGIMFLGSALLTALTVGISPFMQTPLKKGLVTFGVGLFFWLVIAILEELNLFGGSGMSMSMSLNLLYLSLPVFGLLLLLMLGMGAKQIAPPAENHAARIRMLGIIILSTLFGLFHLGMEDWFVGALGALILLPICVCAMCEDVIKIPSIYLPYVKRGIVGKVAGRFFYPGWPSGVLFTSLIIAIAAGLCLTIPGIRSKANIISTEELLVLMAFIGGIFMPVALIKTFFDKRINPLILYFSFQVVMFVAFVFCIGLKHSKLVGYMKFSAPFPTAVFLLESFNRINDDDHVFFLISTTLVTGLTLLFLLWKMIAAHRQIRVLERQAGEQFLKGKAI